MKKVIHVNQHVIRANQKSGARKEVFTVKTYSSNTRANSVEIEGPCKLVYSPDKPLSCGARAWILTESKVVADGHEI